MKQTLNSVTDQKRITIQKDLFSANRQNVFGPNGYEIHFNRRPTALMESSPKWKLFQEPPVNLYA